MGDRLCDRLADKYGFPIRSLSQITGSIRSLQLSVINNVMCAGLQGKQSVILGSFSTGKIAWLNNN